MIRVRFSFAPAGFLSLRAARLALANALFARRHAGRAQLRLEDRDAARCRPDFTEALLQDLHWLGIAWDETLRQSERTEAYQSAAERLKATARLYPCFETAEELRFKQEQRRRQGRPAIYDRAMLRLTAAQRAAAEANGKRPHWRFRLSDRSLAWEDLIAGPRQAKLTAVSDPVLIEADGAFRSAFTGVVDDLASGISHVIEGEDDPAGTAIALDLCAALGTTPSRRVLLPAPVEPPGRRAGRPTWSLNLRSLRADGVEAAALATCLTSDRAGPDTPPERAAAEYDPAAAPVLLDPDRLLRLNRAVLRDASFGQVAERLPAGATEAFWLAVRDSLDLLTEARGWWDVVAGTIVPPMMREERGLLRTARDLLPEEPWDQGVFARWVAQVGEATARQGPALLAPLRLALTGEESGPELGALLPLIGRTRAASRLLEAAA